MFHVVSSVNVGTDNDNEDEDDDDDDTVITAADFFVL